MILSSSFPPVPVHDDISLSDYIKGHAVEFGDHPAFIDGYTGKTMSYSQFFESVANLRASLHQMGLRQNDIVLIFAPNCFEYPMIFHAVTSLGAILTTCNPTCTQVEINYHIKVTQPNYVFTIGQALDEVEDLTKHFKCVKDIIVIGKHQSNFTSFEDLLQGNDICIGPLNFNPKEQICVILFSSGTTGPPKGVLLTHYNLIHCMEILRAAEMSAMTPGKEVFVNILPYYHGFGLGIFMLYSLTFGATNIVFPRFSFEHFLGAIQKYKATVLHLVPPMAYKMLNDPITDSFDLSSVHTVFCAGAPLDAKQSEDLTKQLKVKAVRQGYGMTETSIFSVTGPLQNWKHGSAGVLLPNTMAKIIDVKTGEVLGPNQPGEVCFMGDCLMKGYLNNPKATKETIDDEGWLHTGDIGYCDKEGHFYIIDRLKELIKYNGLQVSPAELESHLLMHPNIADVAVIGVPDSKAGELPCAYIVVKPGQKVTSEDVHAFLQDKVAPYKRLRGGVVFQNVIPRTGSGKIIRRKLKNELLNERKSKL